MNSEISHALNTLGPEYANIELGEIQKIVDELDKTPEFELFKRDPQGYMDRKIKSRGIKVPKDFHFHLLGENNNLVPPEDNDGEALENRVVFVTSPEGEFELLEIIDGIAVKPQFNITIKQCALCITGCAVVKINTEPKGKKKKE